MHFIWELFDQTFGNVISIIIGDSRETIEEKRVNRWMPLYSIFISAGAIGIVSALSWALNEYISIKYDEQTANWILHLVVVLYQALNKASVADWANVAIFMVAYGVLRWLKKKKVSKWDENWYKSRNDFWGVYDYDEELGEHTITDQGNMLRKIFTFFIILNVVFLCIWYGIINENVPFFMGSVWDMLPLCAFMIVLEFYLYITPAERNSNKASRAVKQEKTMDILQECAKWKREKEHGKNDCRDVIYDKAGNYKYVKKTPDSAELAEQDELAAYFLKYVKERARYDVLQGQAVNAGLRLLKGESVYCACQFCRELDMCIFFAMYSVLIKGENGLLIVEDDDNLEDLRKWIKDGIEEIQGIYDLWKVEIVDDNSDDFQIGILSFQKMYSADLGRHHEKFFKNVGIVVILEPSDLLTGGQEFIRYLGSKIKRKEGNCIWMLCDRNSENMVDLFSQLLQIEFKYVNATPMPAEEFLTIYWNSDGEKVTSWNPARRYLGSEADVILKTGESEIAPVYWYGEGVVPVRDLRLIMGQYYRQYCKAIHRHYSQQWIDQNIIFQTSGTFCKVEKEKYLLLEDYMFNVAEMNRQYLSCAREKCILHIFSCDYLLRDFMLENRSLFEADPKFVAQLVPEYVNSERNLGIGLVRKLLEGWQREKDIIEYMRSCEDAEKSWADTEHIGTVRLQKLVYNVLGVSDSRIIVRTGVNHVTKMTNNKMEHWFRLEDDKVERAFYNNFCQAAYVDESGETKYISRLLLAGHLFQKYLPGQYIILAGKYYEVTGISEKDNQTFLRVSRAFDKITGRKYYRQNRKYIVRQCVSEPEVDKIPAMDQKREWYIQKLFADIEVETRGYMILERWRDLKAGEVRLLPKSKYHIPNRYYHRKRILVLGLNPLFFDAIRLIKMAAYLKESMCTFFPQYYHLISIGIEEKYLENISLSERVKKYVFSEMEVEAISGEGENFWVKDNYEPMCIYIIEDSQEDLGLITAIERNIGKLIDILCEYEVWANSKENADFGIDNIF